MPNYSSIDDLRVQYQEKDNFRILFVTVHTPLLDVFLYYDDPFGLGL